MSCTKHTCIVESGSTFCSDCCNENIVRHNHFRWCCVGATKLIDVAVRSLYRDDDVAYSTSETELLHLMPKLWLNLNPQDFESNNFSN